MQLALSNRKSRRRVATATLPGEVLEDRLLLATFSVLNPADQVSSGRCGHRVDDCHRYVRRKATPRHCLHDRG